MIFLNINNVEEIIFTDKKVREYCWPFVDLFAYESNDKSILFFKKEWDINNFLPFEMVDFLGIKTFIPKNTNKFLQMNYGFDYKKKFKSSPYSHKAEEWMEDVITINSMILFYFFQHYQIKYYL